MSPSLVTYDVGSVVVVEAQPGTTANGQSRLDSFECVSNGIQLFYFQAPEVPLDIYDVPYDDQSTFNKAFLGSCEYHNNKWIKKNSCVQIIAGGTPTAPDWLFGTSQNEDSEITPEFTLPNYDFIVQCAGQAASAWQPELRWEAADLDPLDGTGNVMYEPGGSGDPVYVDVDLTPQMIGNPGQGLKFFPWWSGFANDGDSPGVRALSKANTTSVNWFPETDYMIRVVGFTTEAPKGNTVAGYIYGMNDLGGLLWNPFGAGSYNWNYSASRSFDTWYQVPAGVSGSGPIQIYSGGEAYFDYYSDPSGQDNPPIRTTRPGGVAEGDIGFVVQFIERYYWSAGLPGGLYNVYASFTDASDPPKDDTDVEGGTWMVSD